MKKISVLIFTISIGFSFCILAQENVPSAQPLSSTEDNYGKILVLSQTFEALGKISAIQAKDNLIKGLKSKDFFVRAAACGALGKIKARDTIPLLKPLVKDESFLVRILAARGLIELGDTDAEKILLGFLNDENAQVRANAAEQLGYFGNKFSEKLLKLLSEEGDYFVCLKAIEQLGNNRFAPAAGAIRKLIDHKNHYVRQAACIALAKIGDKESTPLIAKRLNDENIFVRSAAKEALSLLGERGYIKLFWRDVEVKDPGSYVGLANLGEINILPVLLKDVINPQPDLSLVRKESARALAILRPFVLDSLNKSLKNSRIDAISSANLDFDYKSEGRNLVLLIADALKDGKNPLYQDAPFILKELRDTLGLPYLRQALFQDNPDMVANVAYVLGEMQDKDAAEDLIKVCNKYGL